MWVESESARLECQQAYWSLSCTFSDVFCQYVLLQSSEVPIRPLLWMRNWGRADGFTLAGGLSGRADTSAQVCLPSELSRVTTIRSHILCWYSPARHGWNLGVYSFVPWAEESSWAYFGWCSDMLIVCFLCYLQAFPTDFVPESHTWKQCSRALGPDCLCSDSRFIQVAGKLCDPEQTAQPLCPQFFHLWNGKNNTTQFIQLLWGYNV